MSTNNNNTTDNTRKRPHNETATTFQLDESHQDGASNNKGQENKRRQILLQSNNWGLREVLVECGVIEFMNEERDGTFILLFCMFRREYGPCVLY